MEYFIEQARIVLPVMGVNIFPFAGRGDIEGCQCDNTQCSGLAHLRASAQQTGHPGYGAGDR